MKNFNKKVISIHKIGFPTDPEIMIPKNDSVRLLYEVRSGLNYSELYKAYSTIGRNPAISPESLFRIVVYGYMEGIYSSRNLEKACRRDINFKWRLEWQRPPEDNTIARFKSERLSNCIEDLFNQFLIKLREGNEIKFENIFIDGRNSFSKTNQDATFMHMKEDHMRKGQLKPGYNIQIGVEGEYIVGVDVSSERSDQLTLIPFLDKLESNIGCKYEYITADAGYESGENYTYLENNNQKAYIKPSTYEKSKTSKFKKDISKRENMTYNQEDDTYICAAGRKLNVIGRKNKKSKSGFISVVTIYECQNYSGCEYKSK